MDSNFPVLSELRRRSLTKNNRRYQIETLESESRETRAEDRTGRLRLRRWRKRLASGLASGLAQGLAQGLASGFEQRLAQALSTRVLA